MQEPQYVILKGHKDGIAILLDETAEFEQLKQALHKKVSGARQFFDGAKTNVSFQGRTLAEAEEKALLNIIFQETALEVSFVTHEGFVPVNVSAGSINASPNHPYVERVTAYYPGGLRSGQAIRYDGSVVVVGDMNPGSEIIAGGNIIVMGALKGMVHAGCNGDDTCFVSALVLAPTQLRIANIITYIPSEIKNTRSKAKKPAYAYIQDGQVYIAPLMN